MHKVLRAEYTPPWKRILGLSETKYWFVGTPIRYKLDAIKNEYFDQIMLLLQNKQAEDFKCNVDWELSKDAPWYVMHNN